MSRQESSPESLRTQGQNQSIEEIIQAITNMPLDAQRALHDASKADVEEALNIKKGQQSRPQRVEAPKPSNQQKRPVRVLVEAITRNGWQVSQFSRPLHVSGKWLNDEQLEQGFPEFTHSLAQCYGDLERPSDEPTRVHLEKLYDVFVETSRSVHSIKEWPADWGKERIKFSPEIFSSALWDGAIWLRKTANRVHRSAGIKLSDLTRPQAPTWNDSDLADESALKSIIHAVAGDPNLAIEDFLELVESRTKWLKSQKILGDRRLSDFLMHLRVCGGEKSTPEAVVKSWDSLSKLFQDHSTVCHRMEEWPNGWIPSGVEFVSSPDVCGRIFHEASGAALQEASKRRHDLGNSLEEHQATVSSRRRTGPASGTTRISQSAATPARTTRKPPFRPVPTRRVPDTSQRPSPTKPSSNVPSAPAAKGVGISESAKNKTEGTKRGVVNSVLNTFSSASAAVRQAFNSFKKTLGKWFSRKDASGSGSSMRASASQSSGTSSSTEPPKAQSSPPSDPSSGQGPPSPPEESR
ncbi:hypothetical protein [Streptomyces sp. NPDC048419]|uniref:hypothetical protein n=1 Tax=Streptomyces sp. NPDC048419 TaxID=3365547 RepID=UPI00371BA335